jgi:hypothetical protein
LDASGFPEVEWMSPHTAVIVRRLVDDSARLMAEAWSRGDLELAEEAAEASLELLDPEDEDPDG